MTVVGGGLCTRLVSSCRCCAGSAKILLTVQRRAAHLRSCCFVGPLYLGYVGAVVFRLFVSFAALVPFSFSVEECGVVGKLTCTRGPSLLYYNSRCGQRRAPRQPCRHQRPHKAAERIMFSASGIQSWSFHWHCFSAANHRGFSDPFIEGACSNHY